MDDYTVVLILALVEGEEPKNIQKKKNVQSNL